jgi:hypothetical protein
LVTAASRIAAAAVAEGGRLRVGVGFAEEEAEEDLKVLSDKIRACKKYDNYESVDVSTH